MSSQSYTAIHLTNSNEMRSSVRLSIRASRCLIQAPHDKFIVDSEEHSIVKRLASQNFLIDFKQLDARAKILPIRASELSSAVSRLRELLGHLLAKFGAKTRPIPAPRWRQRRSVRHRGAAIGSGSDRRKFQADPTLRDLCCPLRATINIYQIET